MVGTASAIVMVSLLVSLAFPPLQLLPRLLLHLAQNLQLKLLRLHLSLFDLCLPKESVAFEVHLETRTHERLHPLVEV